MGAVGIPPDPILVVGAPPDVIAIPILNIADTVMAAMRDIAEALDFVARDLVTTRLRHGTYMIWLR